MRCHKGAWVPLVIAALYLWEVQAQNFIRQSCGVDYHRCSNGQCIPPEKVCDKVADCPYGEDERNCACGPGEFQCASDGVCIEDRKRCDGVNNCLDGTDELECARHTCKDSGKFHCGDGSCISMLLRCDGFRDCYPSGADEKSCPCGSDEWQCDRGHCIERSKRCNGRVDCPTDRSDENSCVAKGQFRCSSGLIIAATFKCDRHYDCPPGDYSDELNCPCHDTDFKCNNGHCIPKSKRCDRTRDCQDASDEESCHYGKECMAYQFKCTDGQCVHAESRCNGSIECADGSDEIKCPCKRGQFRCHDGACINIALRCNGHWECTQGEDEINCGCPPGSFVCNSGSKVQCATSCNNIPECDNSEDEENCQECPHECDNICLDEKKICDGNRDCSDGSDEDACDNCDGPDQFRCLNNECVSANERCNNITVCSDGSDEINCSKTMIPTQYENCLDTQFRCKDGLCISQEFMCDGRKDCSDGTDEEFCLWKITRTSGKTTLQRCQENQFKCNEGRCISAHMQCDRVYDCPDFSDEQTCDACADREFQCSSRECIPESDRCNGRYDCPDGSDEQDCPPYQSPPYTSSSARPVYTTTFKPDDTYSERSPNGPNGGRPLYPTQYSPFAPGGSGSQPDSHFPYGGSTERRPEYTTRPTESYVPYRSTPGSAPLDYPNGGDDDNTDQATPSTDVTDKEQNPETTPSPDAPYDPYGAAQPDPYNPVNRPNDPYYGGGSYDPYATSTLGPSTASPRSGGDPYGGGNYPYPGAGQDSQAGSPGPNSDQYGGGRYPYTSNGASGQNGQANYPDSEQNGGGNYPYPSAGGPGQYPSSGGDQYGGGSYPYVPNGGSGQNGQAGYPGAGSDQYGGGSYPTSGSGQDGESGYPGSKSGGRPGSGSQTGGGSVRGGSIPCERHEWRCENGPCIDVRRRCDGHIDCPYDFSDEFDCPAGSPVTLNIKTYPDEQSVRFGTAQAGGDVVFRCRDEGPIRAPVRWVREGGRSLKSGSLDRNGRLEIFGVTKDDSGIYICQTPRFLGQPGSEVRVTLIVENNRSPPSRTAFVHCKVNEATCGNGNCIPKSAVCDGKFDCSDHSDEDSCTLSGKCEPNQFQCDNRKCVLKTWLCDSEDDCGDESDEQNCKPQTPGHPCRSSEFSCFDGGQCVPKSFHCDGRSDCLDKSDEIGCAPVHIVKAPTPSNLRLNTGDTLVLKAEAKGNPVPVISWRLNWGHVPPQCTSTSENGLGILTCTNMQSEHSGAYSAEALNNKGTTFANPDSIVFVSQISPCPPGYFNSEARSEQECIRCFCFGESTHCRSADLFTYNMPTPLGQGGTRIQGVSVTLDGEIRTDASITNHYYYQALRNGATVTKLVTYDESSLGSFHPYLTLPETYNGQQLSSYGGHIKYSLAPHNRGYDYDVSAPTIIIKGKYTTLFHFARQQPPSIEIPIDVRLTPGNWMKSGQNGFEPASREDIMMALDLVDNVLLRADLNNAGVNITNFVMESAQHINIGLGAASLVEECTCPTGYEGLSCQKCSSGYARQKSGPWLGNCVREECPPGTFGDLASGVPCQACPCPLTNRGNQFARTCSLGSDGKVNCDCYQGYEGTTCERCAPGYEGNPLMPGDTCRLKATDQCNPVGTAISKKSGDCICKENVLGNYCDHCKNNSFYLSQDFKYGCALCFCSGVSQQCMSSNLRRKTTSIKFNTPNIVDQVKIFNSVPAGPTGLRYGAPAETELKPVLINGGLTIRGYDMSRPTVYYWSMPLTFTGDKVTSYGGYLRYTLDNVPSFISARSRNTAAADVQLISDNHLTFQYIGEFKAEPERYLNASVQFLETGWRRSDGKEVSRDYFLLALADVKAILIKASYGDSIATPLFASIDTAEPHGSGDAALHVEQCVCPTGYKGTSCEDCAPGYTRNSNGLYLEHCGLCNCNGRSRQCHPESGTCYGCMDNTEGPHCELCKPGYERDGYDNCIEIESTTTIAESCRCDPRGSIGPCDANGRCYCKPNVEGPNCDRCRAGTFGLEARNSGGCIECYCSGVTQECQEANHFTRIAMAAPVFGDDYGGYTLTDLSANTVIKDEFVPVPDKSELVYIFPFQHTEDLFWSLPVFPGNRVTSYGGTLSLRQEFKTNSNDKVSMPGTDVILVGGSISVYWTNPNKLRSQQSLNYQVSLVERGWFRLGTSIPASRNDFMRVLKNLRRVLVRATVAPNIVSSTIADVSMDTATDTFQPDGAAALGVEICSCPFGHSGTSCESCNAGYYKDEQDYCTECPCGGHDCQLTPTGQVTCNCRPPYTGADCSAYGLLMELHPEIREDFDDPIKRTVILTCKYRAPEPLSIKFVVAGEEQSVWKPANESVLYNDGWHGEFVLQRVWDTRHSGDLYECHTVSARGSTLGVLTTDMRDDTGTQYALEVGESQTTTERSPPPQTTVTVRITSPTIKIEEVGNSVNFTCLAQSRISTNRLPITWTKADGYLPQDRARVDQYSGLLQISNLQISDSGVYICHTNDGISSGQAQVTLKVPANPITIPSVTVRPAVNEYYEGDRIVLECVASGNPTPSIFWKRASQRPLPISSQQTDVLFIIDNAKEGDSGEYSCIASNSAGSSMNNAVISVRSRPSRPREKLIVTPTAPVVNEGQSTRVVCTGTASVPAGTIDWVRQDNGRFQDNVRSDNGVLYIDTATLDNQGIYVCQAQSTDVDPVPILLTVNALTTGPYGNDSGISVPVKELKIYTGESGTVACTPRGSVLPKIKWTKVVDGGRYQSAFGPGTSQRGDMLIINNAQESDTGYYVCEGSINGQLLNDIYVFVQIEKREKPKLKIWPEGEQPVPLGSQFEFHCRIEGGIPVPDISWSRAGGRTLSPTTNIIPNNILKFSNVDVNDEGEYICTGTNVVGTASASAVIRVREQPVIRLTPTNYITVRAGEPINVECRANGYPQPLVSIRGPGRREITQPTLGITKIRIAAASDSDDGDYTCRATSEAGTLEEPFIIQVDRGDGGFTDFEGSGETGINTGNENTGDPSNPNFNTNEGPNPRPSDLIVHDGQPRTEVDCAVSKEFGVRWDRSDQQPLQRNAVQEGNKLVIFNVSKADSGEYVCSMYNYETRDVQTARYITLLVVRPPRIILRPATQTVRPGQSPTVECVVEGDNIQEIRWTPYNRKPSRRVEIRDSTLIFHQIEVEDAGEYQCFARSLYGNASSIAEVIVAEESEMETSESHANEQWVRVGAAVVLSCNVTPGVTVQWTKDGRSVPGSVRLRPDGSLYIRLAQKADSGRYVCRISDAFNRVSSNYINLHIEGIECLDTEFRCKDDSGCIDHDLLCDNFEDCNDRSDEENCILRGKRYLKTYRSDPRDNGVVAELVKIDQPRTRYVTGENVEVLCRTSNPTVNADWEKYGTRQYVEVRRFRGGAMLIIHEVSPSDAGVYRCKAVDQNGRTSYDDFNLEVEAGSPNPREPNTSPAKYTARLRDLVDMPCNHDLEEPVNIRWRRLYSQLPSDARSDQPILHLTNVNEGDAGTYVCRVSNNRGVAVEARAILRVVGVIPSFNGNSWIALPTIKDAYNQFDIEVAFKPTDAHGLILYNSQSPGRMGDYLALQLEEGVPLFVLETGPGNEPVYVKGDRPLTLNDWHTIQLSRIGSQVTMIVDNGEPFANETAENRILDLQEPLYVGGAPDIESLPAALAGASGFVGCISMLVVGGEEKNIIVDSTDQSNTEQCDSCAPNRCLNDGVCQEARNKVGFNCICANGFAGQICDRLGEACHPGICGPGRCHDTADGYKCACPVTHTGKHCEQTQSINYPAFTGSAYIALKPPNSVRFLKMAMRVKPTSPVQDGIIMYCAESPRGLGGFTSLAVRNKKLEFRYDLNEGNPLVLVSNTTLPANEWTDVQITRLGPLVSLNINVHYYEQRLESANRSLKLETPIFVGGVDETIILNNNVGVSGGFSGCIKDLKTQGNSVNIVNSSILSANVQECNVPRGDIPEIEPPCPCSNGATCNPDGSCACPPGFSGYYCDIRQPMPQGTSRRSNDPCDARPCRNGGLCRVNYTNMMNHTCDCPLGFAGASCQMELTLYQSVGFNGNGYLELPARLINYETESEPAIIALAVHTTDNGVLVYQTEVSNDGNGLDDYGNGDFILLRIDGGHVVLEWDMGSGTTSLTIDSDDGFVTDGERHQIIVKFLSDNKVQLTVDSNTVEGYTNGIASNMNADSNIYIGGIPDRYNTQAYRGLVGCIEQIEFNSQRAIDLGRVAVAGRNTQRCRDSRL